MRRSFDGRCRWELRGGDPAALHGAVVKAGAFIDERHDVPVCVFSRDANRETLEFSLDVPDEAAARAVAEKFAEQIEAGVTRLGLPGELIRQRLDVEESAPLSVDALP